MLNFNTTSSEIRLSYQLYGEKNLKPKDATLLSSNLEQRFAKDIIDDLVSKGLWNEALETQLENNQLYFKVFRDDEDMAPLDAIEFENVRMLPNRGLLDLEEPLQNALSRSAKWFGSFIPESIKQTVYDFGNSVAQWTEDKLTGLSAYSSIPKVKELDEDVWQEIFEENSSEHFQDATTSKHEEYNDQPLSTTFTNSDYLLNTVWTALTYAANNPIKTFVLALAASSVANRIHLPKMQFENLSLDFTNGVSTATNILTKLTVAQMITHGKSNMPMMMAALTLQSDVQATPITYHNTDRKLLQIPVNSIEFQINTNTTDRQYNSHVAAFSDATFVVTWQSLGQDGSGYGIYAQRFNSTGHKIGTEFQVNTHTIGDQSDPSVATFPDDSFVVAWVNANDIYGQRFNFNTSKIGLEFQVNTYNETYAYDSSAATFPDKSFVVTWGSRVAGSSYRRYGQRFDSGGNKTGSLQFYISGNSHFYPCAGGSPVITFSDGSFLVTYLVGAITGGRSPTRYCKNYAQLFSSAGGLVSYFQVGYGGAPCAIAAFSDNSFVSVCPVETFTSTIGKTYGQRFTNNGDTLGTEFVLSDDGMFSSVATFSDKSFVVIYSSETGIKGQGFDSASNKIGLEFQVTTYTANNNRQVPSVVAISPDKHFVVTWFDERDGSSDGIFGRIFDSSVFVSPPSSPQILPVKPPIDDAIIWGIVGGVGGAVLMGGLCYLKKHRQKNEAYRATFKTPTALDNPYEASAQIGKEMGLQSMSVPSTSTVSSSGEIQVMRKEISSSDLGFPEELGRSGFGTVYRGSYQWMSTILPKLARAEEKTAQLELEMADMKKQMAQLLSAQTGSPIHTPTPAVVTDHSSVEVNTQQPDKVLRSVHAAPSV